MSDFYTARFRAQYTPDNEEAQPWALTIPGQYLTTADPAREWSAETASHNLVGAAYGLDIPTGNARLNISWEVLVRRPSVAELERYLRRTEIALNTNRSGTLTLGEALHADCPTLITQWTAVLNSCTVRRLSCEEAPADPGAWGAVAYAFTLSNPVEV